MTCLNCGKELSGRPKKFCSNSCRMRHYEKTHPGYKREQDKRNYDAHKTEKIKKNALRAKNNPIEQERMRQKAKMRKKRLRELPRDFSVRDWRSVLAYFDNSCAYCGTPLDKAEQEHFIPVKLSGGFTKDNIVPACRSCNLKKRDKHPLDWLVTQAKGLVAYARITQYLEAR